VSTAHCEGHIELTLRDTGTGFDPVASHTGSGLAHVRDRVTELGGTLTIHSAPGCGATLAVRVPAP
jgi:signal transduction histidine kinase